MILSLFFLFLMLLIITAVIFYLFCFFIPALKVKYEGITDSLASELQFSDEDIYDFVKPDFSQKAVVEKIAHNEEQRRMIYKGEKNCRLFHDTYSSEYKNPKICIGFGDCVKVCPQEAISIQDGCAKISDMCNGCGKCVDFCPENIISLMPYEKKSEESLTKGFKFWAACYRLIIRVRG